MNRLTLLLALLVAPAALADGEESVEQAREELALQKKAQELQDACGVVPTTSIAWKSFPSDSGKYSISGYCGAALDDLRQHCDGKSKKKVIQQSLKGLTCTYGGKDKRGLTVAGGHVTFTLDFEAANNDAFARKELLRSF